MGKHLMLKSVLVTLNWSGCADFEGKRTVVGAS